MNEHTQSSLETLGEIIFDLVDSASGITYEDAVPLIRKAAGLIKELDVLVPGWETATPAQRVINEKIDTLQEEAGVL